MRASYAAAEDAQREADVLRNEKAALEEAVAGLEDQIRDMRLAHRRELRLKGRDAAILKEDLDTARNKIRELNVKIRNLQAVRTPACASHRPKRFHAAGNTRNSILLQNRVSTGAPSVARLKLNRKSSNSCLRCKNPSLQSTLVAVYGYLQIMNRGDVA
jgi:chromosome segregation ATPase